MVDQRKNALEAFKILDERLPGYKTAKDIIYGYLNADAITGGDDDLTIAYMCGASKASETIASFERRIEALRFALEQYAGWPAMSAAARDALEADDKAK